MVVEELQRVIADISSRLMSRYPALRDETERVILGRITSTQLKCREHFTDYVDIQQAYINTNHEDFIGESLSGCLAEILLSISLLY